MDLLRAMMNQDSFRELEHMSHRLSRILEGRTTPRGDRESMSQADWVPAVDVMETDSEFLLMAELPGVKKKNVKIWIEDGVLMLSGQRDQERDDKGTRFHRIERIYGRFARSFSLPDSVDEEKLKAEFENGVLAVHLPKSEKAKPRSIEVQVR